MSNDQTSKDDEIERLQYRVNLLQHIIDIRPAKNAGLSAAYEVWTNNIYLMEFNEAMPIGPEAKADAPRDNTGD
jgi:hypothetical protein